MKKSNFAAMILGTVSTMFFALGMCMAMLPQWNAFTPGIVMGCMGLLLGLVAVIIWRRMEHKTPIKFTGKIIGTVLLAIVGTLVLGVGMCFTMVWGYLVPGILIGLVGIVALLCLVPICKGLK